jgi:4-amino-4-deoxy-L-arabinose transferase-like glycosyltransferase
VAAACLLLTIPVVTVPALVHSMPDIVLLASFATGVLFLVRHHRNGIAAELVLAGLALGVAFGTKWYGVSSVAAVIAVWAGASLMSGRHLRKVAGQGALLTALVLFAGGIWLLRNWIESGNPFFPVRLAPFGLEIFDAPRDLIRENFGFTIADYATDFSVWGEAILPQYRDALAAAGVLIIGGFLVSAGVLVARWRRFEQRGLIAALAAAAMLVALVYSVTPYTAAGLEGDPVLVGADSRYLIPALVIAAALAAWATAAWRWGSIALAALAVPAVIDGARLASSGSSVAVLEAPQWIAGFVAVALVVAITWLAPRLRRRLPTPRARTALLVGAAALGAVITVVAGSEVQERFNRTRYLGADPTTDYLLTQAASDHRVGLAGSWDNEGIAPPLPAFGPRYGNEVEYVGEYVEDMMRGYQASDEFTEALDRGGYDLLLVGRGVPPKPLVREERWAQAAGFERVVASERLALYRAG